MSDTRPSDGADVDVDASRILGRMSAGVFVVDRDWRFTYLNARAGELLGESPDELVGETVDETFPAGVAGGFRAEFRRAMEEQEPVEFDEHYDPLGIWFEVHAYPSESGLSVYVRDVTERKELELERRRSHEALQKLYRIASDRDRAFDEKVEQLLDLGTSYLDLPYGFFTRVAAGEQTVVASVGTHEALQPGETCPLDEAYCRKTVESDGLLAVVDAVDAGWEGTPAYERFDLGCYLGGRVVVDGDLYGTLCFAARDARETAFSDAERTFVELLTAWLQYELGERRIRAALEDERDRLEEFAGHVSHDLRSPLGVATGQLELLLDDADDGDQVDLSRAESALAALERMEALVDDVLALARQGRTVSEAEPLDLAEVAERAWLTVGTEGATLALDDDLGSVDADGNRLRELFENLFRNSVEHGSAGDQDVNVRVGVLDGGGFYVADDGPGIPEDEREAAWELGYSTGEDGTGYGLAIVDRIASAHGWSTRLADAEGGGLRIEIDVDGGV